MFNLNKDKVKVRTITFEKLKVFDVSTGYLEYKAVMQDLCWVKKT